MKEYYYEKEGQRAGPVAAHLLVAQGVKPNTLVWHDGMSSWEPAGTVPELLPLFSRVAQVPFMEAAKKNNAPLLQSQSRDHAAKSGVGRHATVKPPQFSASPKTTKWWHIVLYFIGCIVALLFFRACGGILAQLLLKSTSETTQALEPVPSSSSLDIATNSESSEPTEEIKTETTTTSSDSPFVIVGDYLKDDKTWEEFIGKDFKDEEGNSLPTDEESYDTETEEGTKNAIKLYQCMMNEEGGSEYVTGEPSSGFMYSVMKRVGAKAKKEPGENYEEYLERAREAHTQLISK